MKCVLLTRSDLTLSFHPGQIWGNLISYLVLSPASNGTSSNQSAYDKCGADFSEQEYQGVEETNRIDRRTVSDRLSSPRLPSTSGGYSLRHLHRLVFLFHPPGHPAPRSTTNLDTRSTIGHSHRSRSRSSKVSIFLLESLSVMLRSSVKLLVSTVMHWRHLNQLLLIPLTIWSGLEQSFIWTQFTKVRG